MRTTISIDRELLDTLKQWAAERESTVSRLIEESVRLRLAQRQLANDDDFELVTYGRSSSFTQFDVDKNSVLQELDDLEAYGNRR